MLARLGHFDEGRKAAQGAVLGAAGDAQVQRRTEDHLARTDRPARRHGNGVGLSSQGGAVQHRGPEGDPIHRGAGPGGKGDAVVGHQGAHFYRLTALSGQTGGAR